ncbi:MAG TPA: NAD(P)H-binding protein, partial [Edaphobacter sp.]
NPKSFEESEARSFFTTSTGNLMAAEKAAGVAHHIAVSVVGANRMDSGYMRAKTAQEKLIAEAGVPYTIMRATQFFEFLGPIADFSTVEGEVHLPPVSMQPVAANDVAKTLSKLVEEKPANGIVELAGPEKRPMPELVQTVLGAKKDARRVIADPASTYFGAKVDDSSLVPAFANPLLGAVSFTAWLETQKN